MCDCVSLLCVVLFWHFEEVKTMHLQTAFVPGLTQSQWHSLAYDGNAEGTPVLFPVLCRLPA